MLRIFALLILTSSGFKGATQRWELVKTVSLNESITAVSTDQEGNIYAGTEKGNLIRYNGKLADEVFFSEINLSPVTLVEAWNRLKVFLFFRESQKVLLLDRFATSPRDLLNGRQFEGFMQMAAPGMDNSYWILESNTNELRKYSQERLLLSTPITNPAIDLRNVTAMSTYQNLIIILDGKTGFYFFDQYGNYLYNKDIAGLNLFQIYQDQIITFDGEQIISFNTFNPAMIEALTPPAGGYIRALRISDSTYLFLEEKRMALYQLL